MAENDEGQNESTGGGLRKQLEDALAKIDDLKGQLDTASNARKELAFRDAGIDTKKGVGKLLAERYDGDLDPEEIVAFAQGYDIDLDVQGANNSAEDNESVATTERMDSLRQNSRPDTTGEKLSVKEWHDLSSRDPLAAQQAHADGRVEFSPEMAQQLAANRQQTRLGA